MEKIYIDLKNCPNAPDGYNKGERVEWNVGYALTGTPSARNNRPAEAGGDVDGYQVKSPKASLTDRDNCDGYIFGFADADFAYKMSHKEFTEFVNEFGYIDRDSRTGKAKMRIKSDSSKMRRWLSLRA